MKTVHEWKNQPEDRQKHKACVGEEIKDFAITCGFILCIAATGMLVVIIIGGYPATDKYATGIYAIGLGAIAVIFVKMYSSIKKIAACKSGES